MNAWKNQSLPNALENLCNSHYYIFIINFTFEFVNAVCLNWQNFEQFVQMRLFSLDFNSKNYNIPLYLQEEFQNWSKVDSILSYTIVYLAFLFFI